MVPGPPVPPAWTGCYVGGHIGASTAFLGGGQIGCDYQFARGWVVGVEGQAAWSSLKVTQSSSVTNLVTGVTLPSQATRRIDFLVSATARLGYRIADHWLVYAKGGAAWIDEKIDIAFTNLQGVAVDPSATKTLSGWTAGAGVEWAFAPHWSTALEYNHYDFNNGGAVLTDPANNTTVNVNSLKARIGALTLGANYHF
jgi:outer membrane immunogenic protein